MWRWGSRSPGAAIPHWMSWSGFSSTTLVLRVDVAGDPTVAELLAQVRQRSLAAYEHQDVPFEVLVERLNPTRSLTHHPLIQVVMAWQNFPGRTLIPRPGWRWGTCRSPRCRWNPHRPHGFDVFAGRALERGR